MNDIEAINKQKIDFLINEYTFLSDYVKYNYDERDKYVQFFMAAISAMGAVIGFAIRGDYWWVVGILTVLAAALSYFVFMKVLVQRIRVIEYKKYLNMARGKLWELSGKDKEIMSIILPTEASDIKYCDKKRGDIYVLRILELITAASIGGVVLLTVWKLLPLLPIKIYWTAYDYQWLGAIFALIILVFFILERHWKNILEEEDVKERDKEFLRWWKKGMNDKELGIIFKLKIQDVKTLKERLKKNDYDQIFTAR